MPNIIVDFWSKFSACATGPHIHPEDLNWFKENGWDVQAHNIENFDGFVRGNRFGAVDNQLHLSLLPVPFRGDLRRAKVFILLMNPGLSILDYYAEENDGFRKASIENLSQSNCDCEFPFFPLNPSFAWSGGFIWWEARLRPILQQLVEIRGESYYDALGFLSKQIAMVELVPYHSGAGLLAKGNPCKNLPSARAARQFVQRLCQSPERPLVVLARSHEHWDISGNNADSNVFTCPRTRGVTFSGEPGQRILRQLGY